MEISYVQILVVVANTQVRNLRTEEENGFMRTVIGHEWVGPKGWMAKAIKFSKREKG